METFKNPPITEAIIDIQAVLSPDTDLETLKKFQAGLEPRFPRRQDRFGFQQTFEVKAEGGPPAVSSSTVVDGFLFRSADNQRVVQARITGFAFSKFRPSLPSGYEELSDGLYL